MVEAGRTHLAFELCEREGFSVNVGDDVIIDAHVLWL